MSVCVCCGGEERFSNRDPILLSNPIEYDFSLGKNRQKCVQMATPQALCVLLKKNADSAAQNGSAYLSLSKWLLLHNVLKSLFKLQQSSV